MVVVTGDERTLTYRPRLVTLSDDTTIEHESRGGTLSSVWAGDLGGRYVEVAHLGHGPEGGELAPNVHYLGRYGCRTLHGLKVAYLSG